MRKRTRNRNRASRRCYLLNPACQSVWNMSQRKGALNLFAAFDTRTGKVYAHTAERKRKTEFIKFLAKLDREIPECFTRVHLVMDNLRMHTGKLVQPWLKQHPRFKFHHPPVHCSSMNSVEWWFSILRRKRLAIPDFADKAHLTEWLHSFVAEWNEQAHPFNWASALSRFKFGIAWAGVFSMMFGNQGEDCCAKEMYHPTIGCGM